MLVNLRTLLDFAAENYFGVVALNVNNMEQIIAIMEAARETDSPVIIQASRGARKYAKRRFLKYLILAAIEEYPEIPLVMHLDHGNSPATCLEAIQDGYTSVMMDGSLKEDGKSRASMTYNIRTTKKVVGMAHAIGVSVEGEVGCLGRLKTGTGDQEDGHGLTGKVSKEHLLTKVEDATKFVSETNVDALAIAIGTSHGAYKFDEPPTEDVLDMDRLIEIHKALPNTHLVMHGSSSVPQELKELINEFGGDLKPSWGVPIEEIQKGIRNGVRKVNVDTDNRLAITGAIRRLFAEEPEKFDPRDFLRPAMEAMKEVCMARMEAFGQAGYASKFCQEYF